MSDSGEGLERETVKKKNRIVFIALVLGITLPALHIMFLAPHLPNWLNILIVGAVFWTCFGEIIPWNTVGIFRRKK